MVDINKVYERVLFLANKEQRGYITPDEYNSFAEQAQLEIFDNYFAQKAQVKALPGSEDEYGDIETTVEEKITFFDNTITINGKTDLSTGNVHTQSGYEGFLYPDNFYNLGQVHVNSRDGLPVIADEVNHRDLTYINLSPLTAPTEKQPVYVRHEGGIRVFPQTIDSVELIYLRRPTTPSWAYMSADDGTPIYDDGNSTQFDLHPSEEYNLVYSILSLAGVTIKQPDITGYAEQQTN